jgi:hypothetical protein
MGTIIAFPAERCSAGNRAAESGGHSGSVIILPVVHVQRHTEHPSDGLEPRTSSPRGRRRKR